MWRRLFAPWLEAADLRARAIVTNTALQNATGRCVELQTKLEALQSKPCEACSVLKQQVNHLLLASGSRVKMFDGYGPTLPPPPAPVESKPGLPISSRTSRTVRRINEDFLAKFAEQTGEEIPDVLAPREEAAQ